MYSKVDEGTSKVRNSRFLSRVTTECEVVSFSIMNHEVCRESRAMTYCATATLSSATVPSEQYADYDGSSSQAICSVDANLANQNGDGWTTIIGKHKNKV